MRAEKNRARWPDEHGKSHWALNVLSVAMVFAGAMLFYLSQGAGKGGPSEQAFEPAERTVPSGRVLTDQQQPPEAARRQPQQPQRTAEMVFWEQVERERRQAKETRPQQEEPEPAGRQTSFSDANYAPPKQVNIIQSVPVGSKTSARKGSRSLSGSKSASVRWVDARGNRSSWSTRFEYRDGRIDNSTFCLNIGKGSLAYRDCRKGARQWLKDQCRSDRALGDDWRRMYCRALSSYRT